MKAARRVLQAAAVCLVAALIAIFAWRVIAGSEGKRFLEQVRAGDAPAAPPFELTVIWDRTDTWPRSLWPALADGKLALSELRGYAVALNVWASWCVPCKKEAPVLAASARAHVGKVVFLGMDVQDFVSDARHFLRKYDVPYVSVRDSSGKTFSAFGLTGVPETYYIDARGRTVAHSLGEVTRGDLEEGIAQALRQR
jgi:cytochrome c biogenesis protein CcmG/thiol:disulfide interchange protein DsbE